MQKYKDFMGEVVGAALSTMQNDEDDDPNLVIIFAHNPQGEFLGALATQEQDKLQQELGTIAMKAAAAAIKQELERRGMPKSDA